LLSAYFPQYRPYFIGRGGVGCLYCSHA
jgi:hypothetical protein